MSRFTKLKFKKLPKTSFVKNVFRFFKDLSSYILFKIGFSRRIIVFIGSLFVILFQGIKTFIVRKLIWSRGRLGRPAANMAILGVAFIAFLTGGVFSSTDFVNSASVSPDYLANIYDVIPETTVATTSTPEGRRTEAVTHIVKSGETLSSIGKLYKVTTDALKYINNLNEGETLSAGQKIIVPPVQGVIYKVKAGDSCDSIGKRFEVPAQAILDFNYLESCNALVANRELIIPDAKIPQPPVIPSVIPGSVPSYGRFVDNNPKSGWCQWPTAARIVTQYFSYYHNGVDIAKNSIAAPPPIYACAGGTVTRSGWDLYGLGLHAIIDHGNGYTTIYGHMSKLNVSLGQEVDKGDVIGIMGSTGRSTGPHLHFIISYKGTPQNPMNYIR